MQNILEIALPSQVVDTSAMIDLVPKEKKTRRVFLDARSIVLIRETECERATALVAANTDLDALDNAIKKEIGGHHKNAPTPGLGAKEFGKNFENMLLKNDAHLLLESLGKALECIFTKEDVIAEGRSGEGEDDTNISPDDPKGRAAVWTRTAERIKERWTNHKKGSILIHGILRIPTTDRAWYLEPDLLISPPGCPWYVPLEIKSYEKNAFLENEHEIASAVVQSSLYLHCLIYGYDTKDKEFPEQHAIRKIMQTGIIFRRNGTYIPEVMLASANRDLYAIKNILSEIPKNDKDFKKRFGLDRNDIRNGNLEALDHIKSTYSDACVSGCSLASRCREQLRNEAYLGAWGNGLRDAYPEYDTIGQITQAVSNIKDTPLSLIENPDLRRTIDIENEIDNLIARAVQI